ncbi:MAG: AAA family ATPase [Ignavibacteriaceae bacterium]|nr:AAA family ATPase [Ignavibacteriaceae bacterium]
MIPRTKLAELRKWASYENRKPLIILGARQVGKTTLVRMFSDEFDQYIEFNLEKTEHRQLFDLSKDINQLVDSIFLYSSKSKSAGRTLIFIDEIQNSSNAISMLRYFYEDYPGYYIIAAGSLLESLLDFKSTFPVGRVEFLYLYPLTFKEYLLAAGKPGLAEALDTIPYPENLNQAFYSEYSRYALVGGMPEAVRIYTEKNDYFEAGKVYESLLLSYMDDVEKYSPAQKTSAVLRHVIQSSFRLAGRRITFEGFGGSTYRSLEIKEAFQLLEKTLLLRLNYPSSSVVPPISVNLNKSPKVQVLDTGLINYFAGVSSEFALNKSLEDVYSGIIIEHLTGQELLAAQKSVLTPLTFWSRDKKQSSAEVDYIIQCEGNVIPVEVKSGSAGRLRSMMQFTDAAPHNLAVRLYSGTLSMEKAKTLTGKEFTLINLPLFLAGKAEEYVRWAKSL